MTVALTPAIGASGWCPQLEALTMRGGAWRVVRFPAAWLLLRHPARGIVLVDTGYGAPVLDAVRTPLGRLYALAAPVRWSPPLGTAVQLAAQHIAPGAVADVVVTHWHADHVGALREFPAARVHGPGDALAALRRLSSRAALPHGFFGSLLPGDLDRRFTAFGAWRAAPTWLAPFALAAPVFDDGSLWAVPLPGHALGHVGIAGRDADGPWLWAADAAWRRQAWTDAALPPAFVRHAVCADPAAYRASLAQVAAWHARGDVRTAVAHDAASWDGWNRV